MSPDFLIYVYSFLASYPRPCLPAKEKICIRGFAWAVIVPIVRMRCISSDSPCLFKLSSASAAKK